MVLLIILFIIGLIIFIVMFVKYKLFTSNLLWYFKHCNVIVAGKKGTGKDLTFNYAINKRKDYYYANIPYNKEFGYKKISIKEVSVEPNTYQNFVNGDIKKVPHRFKEGKDVYISDIGIFLPSYMDSVLYKLYPSLPIEYALSRHLYGHNIHCNTQNIERGWKAVREQADFYVICKRTIKIFGCIFITKMITYDRYESARNGLQPIKTRLLNKYSKANVDLFVAQNGDIRKGYIIQFKKDLKYDTRYFEKLVLKGKRKI